MSEPDKIRAARTGDFAAQTQLAEQGIPWWDEQTEQTPRLRSDVAQRFESTRPDIAHTNNPGGFRNFLERNPDTSKWDSQALRNIMQNPALKQGLVTASRGEQLNNIIIGKNPDLRNELLRYYSTAPATQSGINQLGTESKALLFSQGMKSHQSAYAQGITTNLGGDFDTAIRNLQREQIGSWNAETVRAMRSQLEGRLELTQLEGRHGVSEGSPELREAFRGITLTNGQRWTPP
jgi:hypothetical protein